MLADVWNYFPNKLVVIFPALTTKVFSPFSYRFIWPWCICSQPVFGNKSNVYLIIRLFNIIYYFSIIYKYHFIFSAA